MPPGCVRHAPDAPDRCLSVADGHSESSAERLSGTTILTTHSARLPQPNGDAMSTSAKVRFKSTTGEMLAGILDLPEGPVKGWGVFSHGFTLGKDSPAASRMCKALANSGVGMLRFDNLGLGDSAGLWSEGSFSLKVADTVRAAEFMREAGKTISLLVGHSFGGAAVWRQRSTSPKRLPLPRWEPVLTQACDPRIRACAGQDPERGKSRREGRRRQNHRDPQTLH